MFLTTSGRASHTVVSTNLEIVEPQYPPPAGNFLNTTSIVSPFYTFGIINLLPDLNSKSL
jgi:hypothetical protein